ncbi:MAG: enoyl-CoA hydratase-related protein, partial [Pseudomonadales bacterium]|nr:enoyl-CoA hydratase-related protein [Pseudomonadales bacterium]
LYEIEDSILTITLNRPEILNAFSGSMFNELMQAFDDADADDDVHAIIVTGAGRGFCVGQDLSAGEKTWEGHEEKLEATEMGDGGGELSRRLYRSLKPIIVAFNGPAVGVGLTFTLAADVRIAAQGAKMGFVFAARGIVPEGCSSWFLPRLVGISKALEWCYSARVFMAEEALAAGLIRSVHAKEELLPAARALATEFVQGSSKVSNTVLRHMMWRMLGAPDPINAHWVDTAGINALATSPDAKEGINAFLEKRDANFPGKVSTDLPEFFPWWEEPKFSDGKIG